MKHIPFFSLLFVLALTACNTPNNVPDNTEKTHPLPSWREGETKSNILQFLKETTNPNHPHFIPVKDRIAVIDNDGTLWSEQPAYFQLLFAFDQIQSIANNHPEWHNEEPFSSVLKGDTLGVFHQGEEALLKIVLATHTQRSEDDFKNAVARWIAEARHPTTQKPYTQMVFQPMLELLALLRAYEYTPFIVSGGGVDFMRVWVEEVYGIPPYQTVGSSIQAVFKDQQIYKEPHITHINDKAGKPVGIHQFIGKRPIISIGNSDGDLAMMQYTAKHSPSMMIYVHHTDAEREWAYDSPSAIGQLKEGLVQAQAAGWTVIDMQKDWRIIYPEIH